MENRIQPILCCVGVDVSGEPTQFLMERAASAGHLDWHVITVEVAADQLAKAWDGMNAMGFQAVRFFAAHQANAMAMVAEPTASDNFIGGITSALRGSDKWNMWHNSGPALAELLSTKVNWDQAVCWVHGNTAKTRSFLVACRSKPPRKIYWTGSGIANEKNTTAALKDVADQEVPADDTTVKEVVNKEATAKAANPVETNANALPEALTQLPLMILSTDREHELAEAFLHLASGSSIVRVGDMDSRHLDLLLAHQPDGDCALAIVNAAPGSRRKLNDTWRAGEVIVLTPADVVVAEEAYDQARWTGQSANLDILREAYEEYVDF